MYLSDAEMQEGILNATQYYEMGKVEQEWKKLVQETREAAARGDIAQSTVDLKIRQEALRTVGMYLENRATKKGIELTDAQIQKIAAEIDVMFKDAETNRWNAESNAQNANTARNKLMNESGLDENTIQDVMNIIFAIGTASGFGKGGVGKAGAGAGKTKKALTPKYDRWGTYTKPGGYNLK